MEPIIEKVDTDLIEKELHNGKFVRKTNNGTNEIYIITHFDSPNVMREIGRLREVTFRHAGGGTGKSIDIDEFDTCEHPYKQLLVWNPEDRAIVGAYRYILCKDAEYVNGEIKLATTELFHFSEKFCKEYLPYTIELGRSFIQPDYQPSEQYRKGLFSLDNLWDGLGAIVVDNPEMKYYWGKVTMYTDFNAHARDMILAFMEYYFPDKENLVEPIAELKLGYKTDVSEFIKSLEGLNYKEGHAVLNKNVRAIGENIPPLVNAYMNLSSTMKSFGTATNPTFGGVEETGLIIPIDDIFPSKKERHVDTYIKEKAARTI
ncbi:MAG: GNAT family N-acetyltransferase [Bacteroidota bacterium]|nr:GNAT family N-acetyltransferase [Bacteroidota bacterium]